MTVAALCACATPGIPAGVTLEPPAPGPCDGAGSVSEAAFAGHPAALVWFDPAGGTSVCHGATSQRRIPASTFKIPHALIALDAGVLDGPDALLTWDPEKYPREEWWPAEWAADHTLRSALEHSVVWYYREVAELLGPERERTYLEALGLGNARVGDRPTSFWLEGPLEISPEEQVVFLSRLWDGTLPVSAEAQRLTREMVTVLREADGERVLGKTGTGRMEEGSVNWLVGVVERPEGPAFYAFWIEAGGWIPPQRRVQVLDDVRVQAAGPSPGLVLRGVTVIDGTGAPPLPGRDVLIRDGRIVAVVPTGSEATAEADQVLDLAGRFVMPGLVDSHAHVTILEFHRGPDGATRAEYRRDLSERTLRLLLAHGVTTVRNPSAPAVEGVALREDVARGVVVGPRIVTSGPHLNGASMSEAEIRAEVRAQAAAGVDFIKVYSSLDPSQIGAAIEEAHALGLPVVGHLQRTGWTEAARLGIDGITHGASWNRELLPESRRAAYRPSMLGRVDWMDWLDLESDDFATMLRELATRRIPVDPTLITYHTKFFGDDPRWTDHPDLRLIPEIAGWWRAGGGYVAGWTPEDHARARALWPKVEEMIRRYHEAGVLLAAGSDLPNAWTIPGVSLHEELELLAGAGISPLEVLTIATLNGAEALGLLDEIGTLEPGKRADLLVLAADPSLDIRNTRTIERVIQGGRLIEPVDLMPPGSGASVGSQPSSARPPSTAPGVPGGSRGEGGNRARREPVGAPRISWLIQDRPESHQHDGHEDAPAQHQRRGPGTAPPEPERPEPGQHAGEHMGQEQDGRVGMLTPRSLNELDHLRGGEESEDPGQDSQTRPLTHSLRSYSCRRRGSAAHGAARRPAPQPTVRRHPARCRPAPTAGRWRDRTPG
jgi:beta-lactamase class D/imidazolonepropionase-like amidohydrolase